MATPARRLSSNVEGDFYVDDSCIDCGTCRWMTPEVFDSAGSFARVYAQPETEAVRRSALQSLVACPTASIGTAKKHEMKPITDSFPIPIEPDVFHCGYHAESSFGASSYLIVREGGNVLVDSPRFAAPLTRRIDALGGVRWMFLTHRDDVADHQKFHRRYGCERILHRADVGGRTREVERQPQGDAPVELADDLLIIPTPGHTAGSACLLFDQRVLFSGDHVAYSRSREAVHAFRGACWYDWELQVASMRRLLDYRFGRILPGHGAPCDFEPGEMRRRVAECVRWMEATP